MARYSAVNYGASRKDGGRGRRAEKEESGAIYERSKLLGDKLWERANTLAEVLAPGKPADAEELTPFEQYAILQRAAIAFSPAWWEEPEALEDLYRLTKEIRGRERPELLEYARLQRERKKRTPDPAISPQSPQWDKQIARMRR